MLAGQTLAVPADHAASEQAHGQKVLAGQPWKEDMRGTHGTSGAGDALFHCLVLSHKPTWSGWQTCVSWHPVLVQLAALALPGTV